MHTRIIALGQAAAGDDAVGFAVLQALRSRGVPAGVELLALHDASALVELVHTAQRTILVDAVLAEPAGEVLELAPEELAGRRRLSSHGLGVPEALELARLLHGGLPANIRVVGVTIAPPGAPRLGLSPRVAAAIPRALERVLALLET